MDYIEVLEKLRSYYNDNCKELVFINERHLSSNAKCKMYYLDLIEDEEIRNFKKLFQEYLVYYIRNRDFFSICNSIKEANDAEKISSALLEQGKIVHDNVGIYPTYKIKSSGIYGELFDDFYLNIVKNEEILSIYAIRSTFNIPNVKGVDIVGLKVENDNIVLVFSESKFVGTIYTASNDLREDIIGKEGQRGHVTKEYITEYISFVMNKEHSIFFDEEHNELILNKISELNSLMINEQMKPIDAINHMGIKIRFDFFSIYKDQNHNIEDRKKYYDNVVDAFNSSIVETGILNYDIEVIFIPTKNESMDLKEEMELWD